MDTLSIVSVVYGNIRVEVGILWGLQAFLEGSMLADLSVVIGVFAIMAEQKVRVNDGVGMHDAFKLAKAHF